MVENRPNPYSLRIDPEVMDKIKQLAQENSRSVNKESNDICRSSEL